MRETPHSGPTRASATAVSQLGLRCVGAMAVRHASSRLHTGHAQESDVQNGRQPRRGHEPVTKAAAILATVTDELRARFADRAKWERQLAKRAAAS